MKTGLPHRKSKVVKNDFLCCAARSEFGRRAGRSGAETEERGAAKPRGRGLGQRNIKKQLVLTK